MVQQKKREKQKIKKEIWDVKSSIRSYGYEMKLAKVIGTVVATRKDNSLVGYKLMIIRRIDGAGSYLDQEEVAVDYVGAGVGEIVLVGQGSAVRVGEKNKQAVIDMAIIGIIDSIDTQME